MSYQLTNFNEEGTIGATYAYGNDGALQSIENLADDKFDRAYTYDHAGRIKGGFDRHRSPRRFYGGRAL